MSNPGYALRAVVLCVAFATTTFVATAHEYKVGSLTILHPWSRATPKGAPVAGGYLAIRNEGTTLDRLIAIESEAARTTQIHEMSMQDGVMKMRQLANGVEAPAGTTVEFKPGGNHVMFFDPSQPFVEKQRVKATLVFEKAGRVPVEFVVEALGAKSASDSGAHEMMHQ